MSDSEKYDAAVEQARRLLPTGAGFNRAWVKLPTHPKHRKNLAARCVAGDEWVATFDGGWQYMNHGGYYDGWAVVVVTVMIDRPSGRVVAWEVGFRSDTGTRRVLRRDPGLREYVAEVVDFVFTEQQKQQ